MRLPLAVAPPPARAAADRGLLRRCLRRASDDEAEPRRRASSRSPSSTRTSSRGSSVRIARVIFSPKAAGLRLLNVTDETANYIVIWVRRLTAVSVYGYFLAEVGLLLGLPSGIYGLVQRAIGLLVVGHAGDPRPAEPRGGDRLAQGPGREAARGAMCANASPTSGIFWRSPTSSPSMSCGRSTLPAGSSFCCGRPSLRWSSSPSSASSPPTLRRLIDRGFALSAELKARFPGLEARANRYLPFLQTLLRGVDLFLCRAPAAGDLGPARVCMADQRLRPARVRQPGDDRRHPARRPVPVGDRQRAGRALSPAPPGPVAGRRAQRPRAHAAAAAAQRLPDRCCS